jgi:hypothetical protein
MAEKIFILFAFLFVFISNIYSQVISNIDFDQVKAKTTDSSSVFYYPKLRSQFENNVEEMNPNMLTLFYYGNVFTKEYDPLGPDANDENMMLDYYRKKDFENAILIGKKILEKDPTDLSYIHRIRLCYYYINDTLNLTNYTYRYIYLLKTIYNSGDGLSNKTAYVVTRVSDEYQILEHKKLALESQSLIGDCDVMTVKQPNDLNIKELYFNVKFSLDHLRNTMKKNNK